MSSIHTRAARDQSRTVPTDLDVPTAADLAALDEIGAAIGRCLATDITGWRRAHLWGLARTLGLHELAPRAPMMNLVHGGADATPEIRPEPRARAYQHAFDGLDRAAAEDGLTATQRSVFLRLRALAAAGAERRPLEPAPLR